MKKLINIIFITVLSFSAYGNHQKLNQWHAYYQRKIHDAPRDFVVAGINKAPKISSDPVAIDFGCGVGHETLVLLKKGYRVIAIDSQSEAIEVMLNRDTIQKYRDHFTPIVSRFEHINFKQLPQADVVVAAFALPFCLPMHFDRVWSDVVSTIKPGGYFIGNFFDPDFSVFKNSHASMTFHTKAEVPKLFEGFEIVHFKEIKVPARKAGGYDHHYEVIAKKRT